MILARHAEAFFWAGRYLERAEGTARKLEVTTRAAMHLEPELAASAWQVLIEGLGLQETFATSNVPLTERGVAGYLLTGDGNPGSIQRATSMLRENLRTARERVPVELWEESSRLYLRLNTLDVDAVLDGEPQELYGLIRQGCQAVSGVVAEAMTRDEGHAFLVMGRMIERSTLTVQLIEAAFRRGPDLFDADRLLRSTSTMQAFHRIHGHGATHLQVALFLLQSRGVPRSVLSCMIRLTDRLDSIGDADNIARPHQLVGRLRSRLEFQQVEEGMLSTPEHTLNTVRADLSSIGDSIVAHLFHSTDFPALTAQFVRPGRQDP